MKTIFWKIFNIVAGCASIFGVMYLFLTDKEIGFLALGFFCFFLLGLLFAVWVAVFGMIKKENRDEYKKITSFTSYETSDGVHGVYEVFKVIQSKRAFLQQIDHHFKWSGSKMPVISSELQEIKHLTVFGTNQYDKAALLLRRPLKFNETATIHFKAVTDDLDNKAQPYLDYKVNTDINVIHFRVTLKNKDGHFSKSAKLLKKPIDSVTPADYEQYGSVPFDQQSKSYQYCLSDPEIGFYYRLEWEK